MVKARAANKEERCKQLQQKIYLVDRFVEARKVTTPPACSRACCAERCANTAADDADMRIAARMRIRMRAQNNHSCARINI